jgi:hypothetical protein
MKRHQYRYWDGASWTQHVADDGKASADPLEGQADPTKTEEASTPSSEASSSDQPAAGEAPDFFATEYGLTRTSGGWSYTGRVIDALAQVDSPDLCLQVLRKLREQGEPFDCVCILAGQPTFLVTNTKPSCGYATALSVEGAANLIAAIMKSSGSKTATYEGAWIVRLV